MLTEKGTTQIENVFFLSVTLVTVNYRRDDGTC